MTRTTIIRRIGASGIVTAALAIGAAAPAGAVPVDPAGAAGPIPVSQLYPTAHPASSSKSGGGISDLGYVAIGTGAASLALVGVGGTRVAARRRRETSDARGQTVTA